MFKFYFLIPTPQSLHKFLTLSNQTTQKLYSQYVRIWTNSKEYVLFLKPGLPFSKFSEPYATESNDRKKAA